MEKGVSIIGVGKLGLCLSLNLERNGYSVIGVDISEQYISDLNNKKYKTLEPHVEDYLKSSKNVLFTSDLKKSLENDILFIVVQTPSTSDWQYDHSNIDKICDALISFGKQKTRKDLIINSTTFPQYCEKLHKKMVEYNYYVSYNPEFIAQGSIIKDQVNCDNVLIGECDTIAGDLIESIYNTMCESKPIINRMGLTEAELTKISVNCFLTTKISYANMIGDIADRLGCDSNKVLNAVGSDSRIGSKYLKPGFGFGGPCFPRDNRALSNCAMAVGVDAVISKATDDMNAKHLLYQIENFVKNNPNKDKEVEIEYVTYKKNSMILEESQQLKFAIELKNLGYKIKVMDNRDEVNQQLKGIL
jgi:nucleotide sugar dehydrogenase